MLSGYEWLFPIQKYIRLKKCPSWSEVLDPKWLPLVTLLLAWTVDTGAWWMYGQGYEILLKGLAKLAIVYAFVVFIQTGLAVGLSRKHLGPERPYHAGLAFKIVLSAWPFWCWYAVGLFALLIFLKMPPVIGPLWLMSVYKLLFLVGIFVIAQQTAEAMGASLEAEADESAGLADGLSQ